MCEEYLSSKEIMQKIADLKIRLALQQEFEQEVDELVAEVDPAGAGQSQPIRDSVRSKLNTNLLIFQIYEKKHRMDSFL